MNKFKDGIGKAKSIVSAGRGLVIITRGIEELLKNSKWNHLSKYKTKLEKADAFLQSSSKILENVEANLESRGNGSFGIQERDIVTNETKKIKPKITSKEIALERLEEARKKNDAIKTKR